MSILLWVGSGRNLYTFDDGNGSLLTSLNLVGQSIFMEANTSQIGGSYTDVDGEK
jgi:hypothetical protein